jgi:hypothetical protein
VNEIKSCNKVYDQEQDVIEERSWYQSGYCPIRREDVSAKVWERFSYRRLLGLGPWKRR